MRKACRSRYGGMSERFKEPVLKTGDSFMRAVSSNLTPSAKQHLAVSGTCRVHIPLVSRSTPYSEKYSSGEEAPLLRV